MNTTTIAAGGLSIPVHAANTAVVGAGAAGMSCAVRLMDFWRANGVERPHEHVLVITAGLPLGASRMSGSDKQTYYKMGTSPRVSDAAADFARTLTAAGCCHGDTALVEGICSLRAFYALVEAGVPFPHDPFGAFIGYKTDNDPYERATSAGPKTSRFMAERLQAQAHRQGLRILDNHFLAEFLTAEVSGGRRIIGGVFVDRSGRSGNDLGIALVAADNWVLAAGGPGELYASTVYPPGQTGIHAPALLAGLEACNLTESQFGLASIKFRWNVSGTYMQAIPRIFSTDAAGGDRREFLTEYFPDMPTLASSIFLKGYQWPFDAQRLPTTAEPASMSNLRSSLIDLAVHQETVVRGRRVWLDFLANPIGASGWEGFELRQLHPEALAYLQKTGAMQALPIERLGHMNAPAIDIYAENGIDLRREPLEIALCAQHMNGGFAVNAWWESNLPQTFVIGEMAGTHGVKRPGGAALNAGQVGALRAAEFIANVYARRPQGAPAIRREMETALADAVGRLKATVEQGLAADAIDPAAALAEVRLRMTRRGAHLRSLAGARRALAEAKAQYRAMLDRGLKAAGSRPEASSPEGLIGALAARQQCLTHLAILKAICEMLARSAGSRGSHCVLADDGLEVHPALIDPDTGRPYRVRPENEALRDVILHLRYNPLAEDLFDAWEVPVRPIPDRQVAFEPAWAEFRQGRIYRP